MYIEGIFSPAERIKTGVSWDALFNGYCDGARQAEEDYGVIVRLTPDLYWGMDPEEAEQAAHIAVAYSDRGVVGLGIGGAEGMGPPDQYAKAFAIARDGGIGSVPHAGEGAGPDSVRAALDSLGADRIRHGIRAVEDPPLVRELADRGIVLDVCPTSNLRTKVVANLAGHPLPTLLRAGVDCSVSTDDPAMFGTDLGQEYSLLPGMGVDPRRIFRGASRGALCDETTRSKIVAVGEQTTWPGQ